ncbi:MAG: hypothetical protein ACI865_001160 [Flavobacteriaceae bacterium]|jgi:hypothetical protein
MNFIKLITAVSALFIANGLMAQNVGIGTAAPSEKIHVVGGARITSLSGVGNRLVQSNATGVLSNIAGGGNGQVLTMIGGVLTFQDPQADNGLYYNATVDRIRLGGPLVEATTITQGGNLMTFNLNGTGDFRVQDNGTNRFIVYDNGRVEMPYTLDASGVGNTGALEIGNSLRLDGNEIITNTNTTLYLQNDNNGDLRVDANTLNVDASLNVIGLSAMPAAPYSLGAGVPVHTVAYPIEIGNDGNAGQQVTIGYYRGSDPEVNPEQNGGWGYVGYNVAAAGEYWWRMYSGGFINASQREIKRNIHTINEDEQLEDYIVSSIKGMKPSLYNYHNEYDEMKEGVENHFRPAFRIGLIADETPDYILDEGFSGVDIYGLAALSLAGVQHNMNAIEEMNEVKTIQDFGSSSISTTELWVEFSENFEGQIPVVTITSNNPAVTISVVEKRATQFRVVVSQATPGLQFDWIAMAKKKASSGVKAADLSAELKSKLEVPSETKNEIIEYYENLNSTLTPPKNK